MAWADETHRRAIRTAAAFIGCFSSVKPKSWICDHFFDGETENQELLEKFIRKNHELFTSNEILEEFENILKRDFKYSNEESKNIIEKVLQFLTLVTPTKRVSFVKDDPDDNKIIECALESNAEYIVSYDKHLLKLKEYSEIKVVRPEEALGF